MLPRLAAPIAALLSLTLAACTQAPSNADGGSGPDPELARTAEVAEPPGLGACRVLTPDDLGKVSNDSEVVECSEPHTAETFAVGTFPKPLTADGAYDDPNLGGFIFATCSTRLQKFLGGDESTVMRSTLSWAWFRPSEEAWQDGARWYRCDVVGGGEQSKAFVNLPTTAKGLLLGMPDDRWMVCVDGPTVTGSVKIPCSEPHTWRAVTTIKLGQPDDPYPGDREAEVRTQDYCSDSVGAWMNYPVDYDFGYTWFHEQEWKAGNRRSICWARTDQ